MTEVIAGDVEKAMGVSVITVHGHNIDLSDVTAREVLSFKTLPMKISLKYKNKGITEINEDTIDDMMMVQVDWISNYLKGKVNLSEKELQLFVVKYLDELIKSLTIGFGLKTKEELESDLAKANELMNLEKK